MSGYWVPLFGTFCFFGTTALIFYFQYAGKIKKLDTVVKLAESGGEVKPEMLEVLGREGGPTSDLRKGLIWLAIGVPFVVGLIMIGETESSAFGLIPALIGVAYLIVAKFGYRDSRVPPST